MADSIFDRKTLTRSLRQRDRFNAVTQPDQTQGFVKSIDAEGCTVKLLNGGTVHVLRRHWMLNTSVAIGDRVALSRPQGGDTLLTRQNRIS